jgi:hypothetical protein
LDLLAKIIESFLVFYEKLKNGALAWFVHLRKATRADAPERSCHMKHSTFVFLMFVTVHSNSAFGRSWAEIVKSGELRSCFVPWMGAQSNDRGPDGDLTEVFARHLGLKNKPIQIPWEQQFEKAPGQIAKEESYTPFLMKEGKCDLFASNMTILPWRQKKLSFVKVFHNQSMLVTRKALAEKIRSEKDLGGLRGLALPHTTYHDSFLELNRGPLSQNPMRIETKDVNTVSHLKEGKTDVIILVTHLALKESSQKDSALKLLWPIGEKEEVGWGFEREQADLASRFAEFVRVEKAKKESELNRVYRKYFGYSLTEMDEMNFIVTERE